MTMNPCVYILANKKNGTIYTGVTSDLCKRIWEHKNKINDGFTKQYGVGMLVYYKACDTMEEAIILEKQIKAGSRKNKLLLIEEENPNWCDLYKELCSN